MNLKQAQYVKTIAECGSITAAAKKLFVSQPSLSQMLRQLEQDTGLPIFDRSTSPMRLTYAGEKYLYAAERILAANAELDSQLREIRQEHAGRLRLGISVTRAMQVMPLVMPVFQQQYPNVTLQLTESGSANLEELLRGGSIDLAFAALESTSPSLAYELLEKETITGQEMMAILEGRDPALVDNYGATPEEPRKKQLNGDVEPPARSVHMISEPPVNPFVQPSEDEQDGNQDSDADDDASANGDADPNTAPQDDSTPDSEQ